MNALLTILVFLIPSQLALHFWPPYAFIFGIRIDYLSPAVYLTDILVFLLILTWVVKDSKKLFGFLNRHKYFLTGLLIFIVANTFYSTSPFPTLYKWIKIAEAVFLGVFLAVGKRYIKVGAVAKTLFYSLAFFSLIGVLQFMFGKTLGGPLYLLGERSFNIATPGIALTQIAGRDYLRAYSTFSHPNSLAGYISVSFIISLAALGLKFFKRNFILTVIVLGCLFLTFSASAFLGVFAVLLMAVCLKRKILFRKLAWSILSLSIVASLFIPIVSVRLSGLASGFGQSFSQRLELAAIAGRMVSEKFWIGEGLNTFTINVPYLRQPVHNIFLLTFAETGIGGLLLLFFFLYRFLLKAIAKKNYFYVLALVFILVTGMFDHYWLTIQQNLLLLGLFFGMLN